MKNYGGGKKPANAGGNKEINNLSTLILIKLSTLFVF